MRGLKSATIANKKHATELLKGKAEQKITKKEKGYKTGRKKDSDAPKLPDEAFFIFMDEFRKTLKLNFPFKISVSAVGKAGDEKWKSMSKTEKAPYVEKASKRKADYEIVMQNYKNQIGNGDAEMSTDTEKSSSEIHHDEAGQEVSSKGNRTLGITEVDNRSQYLHEVA